MVIAVDITQYCFTPHCVAQVVVPHSSHPLLPIIILYTLRVTFLLLLVKRATFLQSQGSLKFLAKTHIPSHKGRSLMPCFEIWMLVLEDAVYIHERSLVYGY